MSIELTLQQRNKLIDARGKVTQTELASALNLTQAYISQVESGKKRPSGLRIAAWCEILGLRVTVLPRRMVFNR